jgi:hypothetical protein
MPNNLVTFFLSFVFLNVFVAQANSQGPTIPKDFILVTDSQDFGTTKSIQQHGITWTFAKPVQYGQFVNGDYWVVDPGDGVQIINISPGHTVHPDTGRDMNGSMLNPAKADQGFDSTRQYDESLNVGIGISTKNPLTIQANDALVTSISNLEVSGVKSYTKTAAILTCLSKTPPSGSFRPGYSDPDKTIYGNIGDINYSRLGNLAPTTSAPDPIAYAEKLQRTWLMHSPSWTSRFMHPSDNIPDNYYYTNSLSVAALLLNCNFTNGQKEKLLINFIQHGIDLYGAIKARGYGWTSAAGLGFGRKWPILFAGIMLESPAMQGVGMLSGDYLNSVAGYGPADKHTGQVNPPDYLSFAEDALLFYVSKDDIDRTTSTKWMPDDRAGTAYPYTANMIGMPEWGHRYSDNPYQVDSAWYAVYRTIGSGFSGTIGATLSAHIMDARNLWNCRVHFDYVDRYMAIAKGNDDPFDYEVKGEKEGGRGSGFLVEMWDKYRNLYK